MRTSLNKPNSVSVSGSTIAKAPDIVNMSVPQTLEVRQVNPDSGLTRADIDTRRKKSGYNEVEEQKEHPVLAFLKKFWGISA